MKQKSEFHKRRAQESFPLHKHPSLQHLYPDPDAGKNAGTEDFSQEVQHEANKNIEVEGEDIQMKE